MRLDLSGSRLNFLAVAIPEIFLVARFGAGYVDISVSDSYWSMPTTIVALHVLVLGDLAESFLIYTKFVAYQNQNFSSAHYVRATSLT